MLVPLRGAKTSSPGATATFSYTGNAVALITDRAANRGVFDVYLDGRYMATVSGYLASGTQNLYISWVNYKVTRATHFLKVVAKSGRVDVDAILVS